jgi:hypothetical protein
VCLVHARLEEEAVVGGDDRQAAVEGEVEEGGLGQRFGRLGVALQLDIEAVRKGGLEAVEQGRSTLLVATLEQPAEGALGTTGQEDEPLAAALEVLDGDAGLHRVVEVDRAHQAQKIGVAGGVTGECRQEGRPLQPFAAHRGHAAGMAGQAERQEGAHDRLHALGHRGRAELHDAEQVGVVGDRHGRHAVSGTGAGQALVVDRPFEQRVG